MKQKFLLQSVALLLLIPLFIGCGFQLNRNKQQLPANAKTLSIDKVENHSFYPGLDIELQSQLTHYFSQNNIDLVDSGLSDLNLIFRIQSTGTSKEESSQESGKTYRHTFTVSGELLVHDQRNQTTIIEKELFSGSWVLETEDSEPGSVEVEDGYHKALEGLVATILERLTRDF